MPKPHREVFLSHNSLDKEEVRKLAELLDQRGVTYWFDEVDLRAGEPWQPALAAGLQESCSIAICIGAHGIGRWHELEQQAALNLAAGSSKRILPLLLPGAPERTELPPFLALYTYVDLRTGITPELLEKIVSGIRSGDLPEQAPLNPFSQIGPIRDQERFIGRANDLRRLREMLHGGSAVILGGGKMGKSSLQHRLAADWAGKVVGPLNFQLTVSEDDLMGQLAEAIGTSDRSWPNLRRLLCPPKSPPKLLVLLDEVDAAPDVGIPLDFFIRIRAIQNGNPNFKLLACSAKPLNELYVTRTISGSDPFGLFSPHPLKELDPKDAYSLLDHPWAPESPKFSAETKELLIQIAGCHPFRLQKAAYHRFESELDQEYPWLQNLQMDIGSIR